MHHERVGPLLFPADSVTAIKVWTLTGAHAAPHEVVKLGQSHSDAWVLNVEQAYALANALIDAAHACEDVRHGIQLPAAR